MVGRGERGPAGPCALRAPGGSGRRSPRSRSPPAACRTPGRRRRPGATAQKASATARRAVAHEQRALQAQRHALDDAARAGLERGGVGELVLELRHARVEARVGALRLLDLGQEHLERAGRTCQGAQHVEAHDVARALPDRGQRRLAVEARHPRLLDVAGAAEALERLEGVVRRALARPVLADRSGQALEQLRVARVLAGVGILARFVVGAGQAHRQGGRRLGLHAQVGQHVAHQRLVDQQLAEGAAVGGVVDRVDHARAHPGRRSDHAVQARVADHLDDRRHAASGLADHPRPGAVQLDLRGGVGVVAELVLQALDVEGVARAVGEDPRQQEAGQAVVGLGQHQEHVRHRRRAEPLVADQLVLRPGAAAVQRPCDGRVGAHVRAALLLGHRHAGDRTSPSRRPGSAAGRSGWR